MRVLSVIHYPNFGGPHNRNASLTPVLAARGVQVTVLIPTEIGNAAEILRARGVATVSIPLSRLAGAAAPLSNLHVARTFGKDVGRLRQVIRAERIDAVIVNGVANPHAAVAGHLEGVPVVWQILDTFTPSALRRVMHPLMERMADAVMSTGGLVAREHHVAGALADRLVTFFPIVDPVRFRPDASTREAARRRLGLRSDALVVGNIGNLNPMKGHVTFLKAAAEFRRARPATQFVILGGRSPRHTAYADSLLGTAAALGLRVGRDIFIVDPGPDVSFSAQALDVFWLTSEPRSEGIPTVVGEAMALQLPVVATRVGSVEEAVDEGVTGRLVQPRDSTAIAAATLPFADDPDLRRRAGEAARIRALASFSPERCASRHELALRVASRHRMLRLSSQAGRKGSSSCSVTTLGNDQR